MRKATIGDLGGWLVLNDRDLEELGEGTKRVFLLMRDGQWHTALQICRVAGTNGVPAMEGLRRARELRQQGFVLDKKRKPGTRQFMYRLVLK